jgi:hypothetical protein
MTQKKGESDFALLTRREKDWILGKIKVSKAMQRDIRYRIRKKIEILQNEEVPLLLYNGFFGDDESNVQNQSNGCCTSSPNLCSVVTNDDGVVPNHDSSNSNGGRWSSLVKIPPLTCRKVKGNGAKHTEIKTKTTTQNAKWAGSDLNQRPPPCQGGILTKLDHRPLTQIIRLPLNRLNIYSPTPIKNYTAYISRRRNFTFMSHLLCSECNIDLIVPASTGCEFLALTLMKKKNYQKQPLNIKVAKYGQ